MKVFRSLALVGLTMLISAAAFAGHVEINFDEWGNQGLTGIAITNQYAADGVLFSSTAGNVNYVTTQPAYLSTPPNFICTGPIGGSINCTAETILNFSAPVQNLNFDGMGVNNTGNVASIDVFTNGSFNSTVQVVGAGQGFSPDHIDLSAFSNITEIRIYNITDGGGIGWDTFQYDTSTSTPEPGSLLLLGTGVVGLFGVVRRKLF